MIRTAADVNILCAVSFVKKPDFYGPKHKQGRSSADASKDVRRQQGVQMELQDSSVHPEYAAWAHMMTPPVGPEQMLSLA